mgnify:CR=1 FL=1
MPNSWSSQPVFIPGGDPEAMNEPSLLYPGQLGIRFAYITPPRSAPSNTTGAGTPKAYKLVSTDSTMAVNPYAGAVAWFADQSAHKVTTIVTPLGRGRVAGRFCNAVTPGYYTCIQVKGLGSMKFIDAVTAAPTAAGLLVIPSATNGKADCLAAGSAATYPILGRSAGAYDAASATAMVDLDVPEVL